jgi:V8-like Glu-specific endopeptidase
MPAKPPPEPTGPIPWTAAVGRLDAEGDSTSCTATLVEPDVIVTAAHCLFPTGRKLSPAELTFTPNVGAQRLPTVRVSEIMGLGVDKMDPEKPADTPTEVDWAILRLASPIANVTPIPVEPVALADIERRIKAGDDVLSNLGYGMYGITISRRLHRSEGCTLIDDWRDLTKGTDDRLVVTNLPGDQGRQRRAHPADRQGAEPPADRGGLRLLAAAGAGGHHQPCGRRPGLCRETAIGQVSPAARGRRCPGP